MSEVVVEDQVVSDHQGGRHQSRMRFGGGAGELPSLGASRL
jgi:hypothetical protein